MIMVMVMAMVMVVALCYNRMTLEDVFLSSGHSVIYGGPAPSFLSFSINLPLSALTSSPERKRRSSQLGGTRARALTKRVCSAGERGLEGGPFVVVVVVVVVFAGTAGGPSGERASSSAAVAVLLRRGGRSLLVRRARRRGEEGALFVPVPASTAPATRVTGAAAAVVEATCGRVRPLARMDSSTVIALCTLPGLFAFTHSPARLEALLPCVSTSPAVAAAVLAGELTSLK